MTVVALNRVNDYDAWRKTYDSKADFRQAAGIIRESVHQATDDPNSVLFTHGFASRPGSSVPSQPRATGGDGAGGVVGPPRIAIYQDAKSEMTNQAAPLGRGACLEQAKRSRSHAVVLYDSEASSMRLPRRRSVIPTSPGRTVLIRVPPQTHEPERAPHGTRGPRLGLPRPGRAPRHHRLSGQTPPFISLRASGRRSGKSGPARKGRTALPSAPQPDGTCPMLASRRNAASTKAAAPRPALSLLVSDNWSHADALDDAPARGAERARRSS